MTEQNSIAACEAVPEKEPFRQQYYMELVRTIVERRAKELGRPLTACIQTFGCQMNFVPVTA